MQNSKQPSSFVNKKEQSFLQPLGTRDDFKDEILLNDLELYYKNGTFPSVFFLHIACALLTTFIIISESYHLNNLMQHTRIIQSVFYFHQETNDPSYDYPRTYYFTKIEDLNEHFQNEIYSIFHINDTLPYSITYKNSSNLKLQISYKRQYQKEIKRKYPHSFDLYNDTSNPIFEYFGEDKKGLRDFLSKTKELSIQLVYDYNRLHFGVCQEVTVDLHYDTSRSAYITFEPLFSYRDCENYGENSSASSIIKTGFEKSNSYLDLVLVILAMAETYMIILKISSIMKIVLYIKNNLQLIDFFEDFSNEDIYLYTGRNKWDLITKKDIFSLFPLWLVLFLLGSVCQIAGGFMYLITPFLNTFNQMFFGFSAICSWISIGYYFQRHRNYFVFYNTLFKSMKEYKNLFITFLFLFTGFVLFNIIFFNYSDRWYDGFHGGFLTLFAATLGDLLIDIWSATLFVDPLKTMFFGFVLYVLFIGNHLRVMFTMTQESFQVANLENKQSWLENKFDFVDYINQEFNVHQEEDNHDFVIDDIWMRAIVNQDDINRLLNVNLDKLKIKGFNVEQIKRYLQKFKSKEQKKKRSKGIFSEIINSGGGVSENHNIKDSLSYDSIVFSGKNKEIENLFSNIGIIFDKLRGNIKPILMIEGEKSMITENNSFNNIIGNTCEETLKRLKKMKKELNNKE